MNDPKRHGAKVISFVQAYYVVMLAATVGIAVATHTSAPPKFDLLRFPRYMEAADSVVGMSDQRAFQLYHLALAYGFAAVVINVLSLRFSHKKRWQSVSRLSSFLGVPIAGGAFTLLAYPVVSPARIDLTRGDVETAMIYGVYVLIFLIVNAWTFITISKRSRRESPTYADELA